MELVREVGFETVSLGGRFDPFGGTSKEAAARKLGVHAVNLFARRG